MFALTETWNLSPFILDGEVIPAGFALYRHDRPTHGGGVLVAVQHTLPCRWLPSPSHLEIVSVELLTKTPLQVCVIYIPPNSPPNYYSDVFHYISTIACNPHSIVIG